MAYEITIESITPAIAEELCRKITADLPEYFGLPEVNEHYAVGVCSRINFAAKIKADFVGLVSIEFPYPDNANIYWMAVLRNFQQQGVGKILAEAAFEHAKFKGAKTVTVETLAPFEADENYLNTYKFYQAMGFSPLFNLKPEGYEWNMVYMSKALDASYAVEKAPDTLFRVLTKEDIPIVVASFNKINWSKQSSLFEQYLAEQNTGERMVWLAHMHGEFAGYITLKRHSSYVPFAEQNIPEIIDLNVIPQFRKLGIGAHLLKMAEIEAAKISEYVGIGVGLYAGDDGGYGAAQRLYVQHGYIPDGKGVTYNYKPVIPCGTYQVDDDLVLWFTKKLRR